MKRVFILLCMSLWALTLMAQTIDVTVYCDDNYPPYSFVQDSQVTGIYTDILRQAFSQMKGYNVTIKPVPWKRGLHLLETGEGFAIYPPYYHPGKRPYLDYSEPILTEEVVAACRADIVPRENWYQDFKNRKVGINQGFAVLENVPEGFFSIEEAPDNKTNLLKMAHRRIDCYVNDKYAILYELARLKANGSYNPPEHAEIVIGPTISQEKGYVGFSNVDDSKFSFRKDFTDQLNEIIIRMKDNGEIEKIIAKYAQ